MRDFIQFGPRLDGQSPVIFELLSLTLRETSVVECVVLVKLCGRSH